MKRLWLPAGIAAVTVLAAVGLMLALHHHGETPALAQHIASTSPAPTATGTLGAPASPTATSTSPPPPPPPAPPDTPVRLVIPSIGVNAAVEPVGVTAAGAMDVPKQWQDVGWFNPGPTPGQPGDAVIDGHLDSTTGPAVFIHLAQVRTGDAVVVVLASGTQRTFLVSASSKVAAGSTAWSAGIFAGGPPHLLLITCSGTWDRSQGQYQQRLLLDSTPVPGATQPAPVRAARRGGTA